MKFDYIIIGAGSAGCILANRLSEDPSQSVLLLEAGGKDTQMEIHIPAAYSKLNRTKVDWAFYTEPQANVDFRRMFQPRGKTLGGCSSTNAMAYVRGNKADYNHWADLGNEGWSYEEVLPYFIKSENNEQIRDKFHGTGGPLNITFAKVYQTPLALAFIEACKQKGIPENKDFNGEEQEGAGLFQFTIKDQRRHSAATAFLKPVLKRPNLKVWNKAQVSRILIENDRAIGVEFFKGQAKENVYCKKEVILSAGTFQSPQLLMLSGIGEEEELKKWGIALKKNLPGVGKNLQDHVFCLISSLCKDKITANHQLKPLNQLKGLIQYLLFKKGPFTTSPLEANAFIKTDASFKRPDFQLHFAPVHLGSYDKDLYDVNTYPHSDGYSILPSLIQPKSRGFVALKSGNPKDTPLIQPNYLASEEDSQALIKGARIAYEILSAEAFAHFRLHTHFPEKTGSDEELLSHIRKTLESIYHPVGTCKMGLDEMAVVDKELRVKRIENLRVIDASVMPVITSGNTNAPVMMIAEKGADLVKGLHRQTRENIMKN